MPPEASDGPVETLIVDDVAKLRELLADALADTAGFRVVGEAGDGREAIAQARDTEPDLVLLDLSMPRMDGLEALAEIRRHVPTAEVVVLSGFTSERMEALVEERGALAYVEKGIEPEELVRRLGDLLRDGSPPSTETPCCPAAAGSAEEEAVHLHVIGLDKRATKRLSGRLSSADLGWRFTTDDGRQPETVPDGCDLIVVAVADCADDWEPSVEALASRYPEIPTVVAVPDIPSGCLQAAVEAGAQDIVDLDLGDAETLALRLRWAMMVSERHDARTRHLDMLAGTMAHDLRQPLRALDRYADWVQEGLAEGDPDRVDTALEGLQRGVDRARRLIESQLTYARLRTKPPPATETDPEAAIAEACEDLSERIETADAVIRIGSLPSVLAPPEQLTVLFRNLVSNAIKYREEKQAPMIEIHGEQASGQARIHVSDDGIGIEPEHQAEIFDPFTRLHAEQDYPGTGLGLAICRQIVEQQGGDIEVASQPGEGTTFTVSLPTPDETSED